MKATEGQTADKASTDLGEATFANSCLGCHAISGSGAGGTPGPNLTTFGDRNRVAGFLEHNEESLKAWIKNPEEFKPGNLMMNSDGTALFTVIYLMKKLKLLQLTSWAYQ